VINARTGTSPAPDVDGAVWARDGSLWTGTDIKLNNLFTLPVTAGPWTVNYSIDPDSGFVKTAGPRTYALQAGQMQYVPLPVVRKDGLLTGTVVLTDGVTPAKGARVVAEAVSHELNGLTLRTQVQDDGSFSLTLPFGAFRVRAEMLGSPDLINPPIKTVFVPLNGSASVRLRFRTPDALITGTVTLSNSTIVSGMVNVWAWSDDDGYAATQAPVGGVYTLPVKSGMPWHVVAVFETRNQYWIARALVPVPAPATVNDDLVLNGPKTKPAPVSVVFDASADEQVTLPDGTSIFIPAGSLPVTGRVVLHITPLAAVPHHRNGDVLGLSYVFEAFTEDGQPITQDFNADVSITFRYNPLELAALGLDVDHLRPAYYSTTSDSWTAPDSFLVDETTHEITLQVNHFTDFGLVSVVTGNTVFLPTVQH
jgi:hypothetical protein